jgi:hypothetical protein
VVIVARVVKDALGATQSVLIRANSRESASDHRSSTVPRGARVRRGSGPVSVTVSRDADLEWVDGFPGHHATGVEYQPHPRDDIGQVVLSMRLEQDRQVRGDGR